MKKLRIFWAVIVVLVTAAFAAYRINEIRKEDSSGPVFSCDQMKLEVSIHDGDDVLLQGITAQDKKDGDVTASILVEKLSSFYGENQRLVTYAAFDSDNHITEMEREITYTDYTKPKFALNGSLRFKAGETINIDQIVTARDCLDGDLSRNVKILMDGTINNRITGFYDIEYQVTNSAGDSVSLPIRIEVYQQENNEVEMNLKQYLVYYEGEDIDYKDYLKSIKIGNLEYPFEGVVLEGMEGMKFVMPEEEAESEEDAEENQEEEDGADAEPAREEDEEDPEEGQEEEVSSESADAQEENVITFIPKSRVTVRSSVDASTPGVYPVYFYYIDEQERFDYVATEVLYVVVE
ncbi:MAG: hypothetical protein Q4C58_04525 [Eubacteriales bacterium]|nr:hypothetical protein [Eubacteriales bacterium]